MADITAIQVKELRERTGVGIIECKKALIEAQGDIELAIDNMRKLGQANSVKKAGRITAEGIILIKIAQDGKYGVIMELNCETDFVARSSIFKAFGNAVITEVLKKRITLCNVIKDTFEDQRISLVVKTGENINIRRLHILEGDMLYSYLHGTRIGVIISASGADKQLMKHIAMHIAASKPDYVDMDNIPADVIAREYQIQLDIAMQSGKSREIAKKIVEGRMRKFTDELSLIGQHFVMDPSKTVGQLLDEYNAKVNNFIRFEVGEHLEKETVCSIVEQGYS